MEASATFVIADDHAVVRRGVLQQLRGCAWLTCVGEADNGTDAVQLVKELAPDLALVDLRLPGLSGIAVIETLQRERARTRVILFSAFTDASLVRRGFEAGARGFVDKASDPRVFDQAVREVHAGKRFIDPRLAAEVVQSEEALLSEREQQILQLIADGLSNAGVAEQLGLGTETVKTHVRHILEKLKAESRTEMVAIALRRSLIQ
jgi:two-component system nitrate/nitrite response regulator NarL